MPDKMPLMADLLIENLDAPGSKEIAKRLRMALPPEFQEGAEAQQAQMLAELQGQAQQSAEMLAQAQGVIQQQQDQMMQLQGSISQLQAMVLGKDKEVQAKLYNEQAQRELDWSKTQANNDTKVYLEQIKQSGNDERTQAKIIADYQTEQMNNDADLEKEYVKLENKLIEKTTPTPKEEIDIAKEFIPSVPGPISTDVQESQSMISDIDGFMNQ